MYLASNKRVASQLPQAAWYITPAAVRMWKAKAEVLRVMKHLRSIREADAAAAEMIPGWTWNEEATAKYVETLRAKYWEGKITPHEMVLANAFPGWRW